MKKLLSTILCFILTLTPISTNARTLTESEKMDKLFKDNVIPESVITSTSNEYEEFKKLQNKTYEELIELGWNDNDIKTLKEFNYEEEFKKRINLSESELEALGYTPSEINDIKKLSKSNNLTEEQLIKSAAKIRMQGGINKITNNYRDWYFYYQWGWDKVPIFKMKDIIGVRGLGSVKGSISLPVIMGDSSATTIYMFAGTDTNKFMGEETNKFEAVDIGLSESVFEVEKLKLNTSVSQSKLPSDALSGYGLIHFNNSVSMERLSIAIQYGHSQVSFNPGIDISVGLPTSIGAGFSFSSGVNIESKLVGTYDQDGKLVQ